MPSKQQQKKTREVARQCEVEDCGKPAVMQDSEGHWRCGDHTIAPLYAYWPERETR